MELEGHQAAESSALTAPILHPTQLSHAARSQDTGQAGTRLRIGSVARPPIQAHAVRRSDRHQPLSLHQTLLDFIQVGFQASEEHKGKPPCLGHPIAPMKEGEGGTTLLPARIPSAFKCQPVHMASPTTPGLCDLEVHHQELKF